MAIVCVIVSNDHFVFIDINRVNEYVKKSLEKIKVVQISLPERLKPKDNMIFCNVGLLELFLSDPELLFFNAGFQLQESFLRGRSIDSVLNSFQNVVPALFCIFQSLLKREQHIIDRVAA